MESVTVFCEQQGRFKSRGYIFGEDPLQFPTSLVLLQIALVTFLSAIFQFILKPFGQQSFVPQILGGIAFGPSFFGLNEKSHQKMFSPTGIASFALPFIMSTSIAYIVRDNVKLNEDIHKTLPVVASFESTTSFQVILALLTELKLLNSELGRVALSSSLVSGISSWIYIIISVSVKQSSQVGPKNAELITQLSKIFLFIVINFVFRPIMFWMMRETPEGKSLKESYICAITLMVFGCSLFGEYTGQHFLIGPLVLGLTTPDRPPMECSLIDKMGCFVWAVLMSCYCINIGKRINMFHMGFKTFVVMEFVTFIAVLGKTIAIMIPSLYYKMPFMDTLSLVLILNPQGFFDIQIFNRARQTKLITEESFGIMALTAILHTAILAPSVKALYDPSRRYIAYNRRTIQHNGDNSELRILACIYEQDNVSSITGILEASNPTRESPMGVCVLHLAELVGRTMPSVISHQYRKIPSYKRKKVNHIANAFYQYEDQNRGPVVVQFLRVIGPFATMHDDVCSLALKEDTCLVIIPSSDRPLIREVNKNVLEKAPCSVGILFNRGAQMDYRSILSYRHTFNVCVLSSLGGPGYHEALVYGARMGRQPNVRLTVLRLVSEDYSVGDLIEKRHDLNVINEFRVSNIGEQHFVYKEESVTEASDIIHVLGKMGNDFDLILVGRRHDIYSPLLAGLSEWSEMEELGVIGDLLASSDFDCRAAVLVMGQQASVVEKMIDSPRYISSQV